MRTENITALKNIFAEARELELKGDYEAARALLGIKSVGEIPDPEGLDIETRAELFLRWGTVTGYLGASRGITGAQDAAKEMLRDAADTFDALGLQEKRAESLNALAVCEWREGDVARAIQTVKVAIELLEGGELKALALINLGVFEWSRQNYFEALWVYRDAESLLEGASDFTRGLHSMNRALALKALGEINRSTDDLDAAIIENAGASHYFELVGHLRYQARVENNCGNLLRLRHRFIEARTRLNKALKLFEQLRDTASAGQVEDSIAQLLISEGKPAEAERVARSAIRKLETGEEQRPLHEARRTLARAILLQTNREGFSLDALLDSIAEDFIWQAIADANGVFADAANALGLPSAQNLNDKLNRKFPHLRERTKAIRALRLPRGERN